MATDASNVLLAHKWEPGKVNPAGWWMSEKLDGVRAYWSGSAFYSRNGNVFPAPEWFTADLPKIPLDGELWAGRGQFSKAISIAKSRSADPARWHKVSFAVFDAPKLAGTYEVRCAWLGAHLAGRKYAAMVPFQLCRNQAHLDANLAKVEKAGGEGLMLRQPGSAYEHGRSHSLLKVKSFHDEEGIVVGFEGGKGKNAGRCGALLLQTPDGRTVKVGTGLTDAERRKPPKRGVVVTYKFFELSASLTPRFPTFVGVRTDLDWAAYCADYTAPTVFTPGPLKRRNSILFGDKIGYAGGDDKTRVAAAVAGADGQSAKGSKRARVG